MGPFRLPKSCPASLASVKDRDPKAVKARLDALEAAIKEIRHAVWMPQSTLPAVRKRVVQPACLGDERKLVHPPGSCDRVEVARRRAVAVDKSRSGFVGPGGNLVSVRGKLEIGPSQPC